MNYMVNRTISEAVRARVAKAEGNGRYISVYDAAQQIQDEHPAENVALEDIVSALVDAASTKPIALELSNPPSTVALVLDAVQ